jgi:hypothetical protein
MLQNVTLFDHLHVNAAGRIGMEKIQIKKFTKFELAVYIFCDATRLASK